MHGNADGAGLVRYGAGDGLADPPGGVGGEFVPALVFKLVHGLHEADVALLDKVQKLQAPVSVFFGDGNHQAQVGADKLLLGAHGGVVAAFDAPEHFLQVCHVVAAFFLQALEDFNFANDHFLEGKELVHAELEFAGGVHGVDLAVVQAVKQGLDFRLGAACGKDVG